MHQCADVCVFNNKMQVDMAREPKGPMPLLPVCTDISAASDKV